MIAAHYAALQVVAPLIAAPLCVLLRRGIPAWLVTVAISWIALAIAIQLLIQVLATGTISYELGGWAAPWGIEYRVDSVNAFVLLIVSGISAVTAPYAHKTVVKEIPEDRHYLFYAAYLLCLTGLLGIAITGDAFNVFVFLEISSLSSYVLISLGSERKALTAAYQYLVMGTIGATFFLIGVGLIYAMTGTLNMADIATRLDAVENTRTVLAAFAFITVGLGLKLALFPLHLWLPNAYAYAPSAVTVLLAATATKVAIYTMLRFVFTLFGSDFALDVTFLAEFLMALALVGVFAASITAIFQNNVKRMLAYSSVAQVGYMLLGVSFFSVTGLTGGIVHLFNHAMMKGALFMALGAVFYRLGSVHIDRMRGLGKQMPLTMFAFVLGGLSLIGLPLTVGFISKWYLILAALERGWWPIAGLILLSSLLAVAYIWRVVEAAYFRDPATHHPRATEAPPALLVPTWILVLANFYFGIDTSVTVGIADNAAKVLLGSGG
ncbi:MAG: monovalent cation/H+ antiporter subunit D family protein [Alphaproteobacteria bacterium]|nr:monovalent cation/H+ antiporter subunit D family protein [Alphaproteobacteria bacterium]MCY4499906.1 monovalent cation/H+ antiporter subunit D family protein [Rhodospirillaceae bacterium]